MSCASLSLGLDIHFENSIALPVVLDEGGFISEVSVLPDGGNLRQGHALCLPERGSSRSATQLAGDHPGRFKAIGRSNAQLTTDRAEVNKKAAAGCLFVFETLYNPVN